MIVYLDLDRTLFQTSQTKQIWDVLATLYPEIDPELCYEERTKYRVDVGDQYYEDMARQLAAYGLDAEIVYEQLRETSLADGRFEFEGCPELVASLSSKAEVHIFTFGTDDYQRFKASLCPSLMGLPIVTTLRAKGDVLADSEEECWLVDDKPIGDELPPNASFVQVSLEGKDTPPDAIWPVFRSLGDVQVFFEEVLS